MYYVRNKERGYLGNAPLWYGQNGAGYTDNLDKAHKFTHDEAQKMVLENPEKWDAWQCAHIDSLSYRTFDSQDFGKIRAAAEAAEPLAILGRK